MDERDSLANKLRTKVIPYEEALLEAKNATTSELENRLRHFCTVDGVRLEAYKAEARRRIKEAESFTGGH